MKEPFRVLFTGSTYTTSVDNIPSETTTKPATAVASGKGVVECPGQATALVKIAGTDAADETVNWRAVGWNLLYSSGGVLYYEPTRIGYGVATLGALTSTGFGTTHFIADTITQTDTFADATFVKVLSPANDRSALLVFDVAMFDLLELQLDLGTAASAALAIALGEV
jgi:hypothetical protein